MTAAAVQSDPNTAAEQALLGCLLLDNRTRAALNDLAAGHFEAESHRLIFSAILDELDDEGVADPATVFLRLQRNGDSERSGGLSYLNALAQNTPSAANAGHYAELVRRAARERRITTLVAEAHTSAQRGDVAGAARLAASVAELVEGKPDAPRMLDLVALAADRPAPPKFVVDGLLPESEVTLLAGHGGSGKSTIALILAVCLALGLPFFGVPAQRRRVAFFSFEDPESVLHWRLSRACSMLGVDVAALAGLLHIFDCTGGEPWFIATRDGLAATDGYRWAAQVMRATGSEVAVVDGTTDVFCGNENDRSQVRTATRAMRRLVPLNGALLLCGHVDKSGLRSPADSQGFSGSTAWHNGVRSRLYLHPEADDSDLLVLECRKSNHGPLGRQISIRWNDVAKTFVSDCTPQPSAIGAAMRGIDERIAVLDLIRAAEAAGDLMPSAVRGDRSAHAFAEARVLPDSLRGRRGRGRFYACIEELRAAGTIKIDAVKRPNRHLAEVFRAV